jgi:hypothetical protein
MKERFTSFMGLYPIPFWQRGRPIELKDLSEICVDFFRGKPYHKSYLLHRLPEGVEEGAHCIHGNSGGHCFDEYWSTSFG